MNILHMWELSPLGLQEHVLSPTGTLSLMFVRKYYTNIIFEPFVFLVVFKIFFLKLIREGYLYLKKKISHP